MKKCTCGKDVADDCRVCPQCGHRLTKSSVQMIAWLVVILGIAAVFAFFR